MYLKTYIPIARATGIILVVGTVHGWSTAFAATEKSGTKSDKILSSKTATTSLNASRKQSNQTMSRAQTSAGVNSDSKSQLMIKGANYWRKGQYRNAIKAFDSVIEIDPKNAEAYAWRGLSYYSYNDLPNARKDLVSANKLGPENLKTLTLMSELQSYDAQYKSAIASCDKILSKDATARTYFLRSNAHDRLFNFPAAQSDLTLAGNMGLSDLKWERERLSDFEWDHKHAEKDPAKRWALACSAPMFEFNNRGIESLAGAEPNAQQKAEELRTLDEWWGITSKAKLVNTITRLLNGGMHHPRWMATYRAYKENPAAFDGKEGDTKLMLVKEYGDKFGEHGIQAFDLSRVVSLCRWGYMGGFLTEGEAFELMLPAAVRIQKEYTNWDDFVTGYFVGRRFWNPFSYTDGPARVDRVIHSLKSDPNILRKIPWDTKLLYDAK